MEVYENEMLKAMYSFSWVNIWKNNYWIIQRDLLKKNFADEVILRSQSNIKLSKKTFNNSEQASDNVRQAQN